MEGKELEKLQQWIREYKHKNFYKTAKWLHLRNAVMTKYHFECVRCKSIGVLRKAEELHHVKLIRKFPEYADIEYLNLDEKFKYMLSDENKLGNIIEFMADDKPIKIRSIDGNGREIYIDLNTRKILNLVPLCKNCHTAVHLMYVPHDDDINFPMILD